jgi:mannose-6-phosphate isomerase-like protein (cupin superfamily)
MKASKDAPDERSLVFMPGEGKSISVRGVSMTYKAAGADTNGAWTLIEYTAPPRFSAPHLHRHEQAQTGFYILSGTLAIQMEKRLFKAPAGSFVLVPPGVAHKFSNKEVVPVTFLIIVSPAGLEQYFEKLVT